MNSFMDNVLISPQVGAEMAFYAIPQFVDIFPFFAVAKMGREVVPGLLESIRKATSERKEYGGVKKA
jgi:hypothetical protein